METIFLSYRRDDGAGFAGRLAEDLKAVYGNHAVFRDVNDIHAGEDFVTAIQNQLEAVQVVLVMIGPLWTGAKSDGTRRIDDPQDFVRLEISGALKSKRPVIPVLVGGASMPSAQDLPEDLKSLARVQAVELSDARWQHDLNRLTRALNLKQTAGALAVTKPIRRLAGWSALVLVAAVALYIFYSAQPVDIDGIWHLPQDGHWAIDQSGNELNVKVLIAGMPSAWMRGTGRISGKTIQVRLLPQYDNPYHHRYVCNLKLDKAGRQISGTIREETKGIEKPLRLKRP